MLVYGEGDWHGQPVRLQEFQRRFIYRLYEYWPSNPGLADGRHDPRDCPWCTRRSSARRRYKRAGWGMGKGNGKTPVAGFIGAYELCGGVAASPRVIIGAASLKQGNLVFGDLKTGVSNEGAPLEPYVEPYDLRVFLREEEGVAERVAAVAGTNDGARATAFLADELHEWTGRAEDVYDVVDGAVGKRKLGFTLWITTAGVVGQSRLLETHYAYGKKLASGELLDDETLFEWYEADEGLDLDDPDQRLTAILQANPAVGIFNSLEFIEHRFQTLPRYKFVRYHTNRPSQSETSWLPPGAWDECAQIERDVPDGSEVVLAFSGTYDNDAAGLVAVTPDGHVVTLGCWEDPAGVDREEVDAELDKAMMRYRVRRLVCNPMGWHEEISRWSRTYRKRVAEFDWAHQLRRRADACSKFFTAVKTRALTHDGDPRMDRHLASAEVHEPREGAYITQGGRESSPISLAVAAVMAFDQISKGRTGGARFAGGTTV
jgi:phage terminase large subunit-like protein